jgi:hypothetical protein
MINRQQYASITFLNLIFTFDFMKEEHHSVRVVVMFVRIIA